jgi:hypothetical protein
MTTDLEVEGRHVRHRTSLSFETRRLEGERYNLPIALTLFSSRLSETA